MGFVHRFDRTKHVFLAQDVAKCSGVFKTFGRLPCYVEKLTVVAGLFRPASVEEQHLIIFTNIVGKLPIVVEQLHGKKKKKTFSLAASLTGKEIHCAMDKFINELLARVVDFKTIRLGRVKKKKIFFCNYSYKLNARYTPLSDFYELVDDIMYTKNKGLFMPLAYNFVINARDTKMVEDYFHKLQLPFIFYRRKVRPAFDDKKVIDIRKSRQVDNSIWKAQR